MASDIEIVNVALTRMGEKRIAAFSDPNERARVMSDCYATSRDRLLRAFRWNFAMQRTQLAADAGAPSWGFSYRYLVPGDFLKLDMVNDIFVGLDTSDYRNKDDSEYALEANYILTNIGAPLKIRYIRQVTTAGLFDASFVAALSCRLALDTVERITQSTTKKESIRNDLKEVIVEAVRSMAIEKPPQPIPDESWMIGRIG